MREDANFPLKFYERREHSFRGSCPDQVLSMNFHFSLLSDLPREILPPFPPFSTARYREYARHVSIQQQQQRLVAATAAGKLCYPLCQRATRAAEYTLRRHYARFICLVTFLLFCVYRNVSLARDSSPLPLPSAPIAVPSHPVSFDLRALPPDVSLLSTASSVLAARRLRASGRSKFKRESHNGTISPREKRESYLSAGYRSAID